MMSDHQLCAENAVSPGRAAHLATRVLQARLDRRETKAQQAQLEYLETKVTRDRKDSLETRATRVKLVRPATRVIEE